MTQRGRAQRAGGMGRVACWLLAVCAWLCVGALPAATVYGQGSGLPNLSVPALAADAEGFLWVGTEDGLVRFDGHRFEPLDLDVPGQPVDARVNALLVSADALWIATRTRLLRLDWQQRALKVVVDDSGQDLVGVSAFCDQGRQGLLVTSFNGQFWRVRTAAGRASVTSLALTSMPAAGNLSSVHCGPGGVWIGSTTGAWRYDQERDLLEPLRFAEPALDAGARHVRSVFEQPPGQLWLGYWNDGLVRLDLNTGRHRWFHPARPGAGAFRSTSVYTLAGSSTGEVHIGSNRGLMVWQPECDCIRGRNHPEWDKVDGAGVIIESLLLTDDALWAGQFGGGLYRFSREDAVFEHQVKVDGRTDSLANGMVRALHFDGAGRLWIGSYGGGVQWVDAAQRRPGELWPLENVPWPYPRVESRYLWSIDADGGSLLLSTGTGWFRLRDDTLSAFDSTVESARTSLRTAAGRLYVGGAFGLFRVVAGDRLQAVRLRSGSGSDPGVWSLSEQRGQLWVGSAEGLFRLTADETVIAHHRVGLDSDALPGALVLEPRRAPDGQLWLPTSGGLVRVHWPERAEAPRFSPQIALVKQKIRNVASLEIDAAGQLWLGTPRGLVRYDPRTGAVDTYDHRDGLVSNQLVTNGSANDGRRLYFGTVAGLISFDPATLPPRHAELRPRIARWRTGQGPWQQPDGKILQLPHDHEPLQLELTALHFRWPEQLRYLYRWRDQEGEFVELGDARTAVFSDLPGGEHELELCAVLAQPFFAERRAVVLKVSVQWPWQHTWWGRLVLVVAALLSIYLVFAWRSRRSRVQRRLLERLVAQRTQELERASAAMEAANARLRSLALVDPLTGLANRRQLFDLAERWQREGRVLAVVMVDIDHFKRINDQYGHEAGDAVLKAFAQQLGETAGVPDASRELCARYGGEEFVWLLADGDEDRLAQLADLLLQRTRALRIVLETSATLHPVLQITVSIGAACAHPGEPVEALIRRADTALYRVKAGGRDGWRKG